MFMLRRTWNHLLYWLSPKGLTSGLMLKALLWINLLGTIYGYYWYWDQMKLTLEDHPAWMLPFVPDSPTASLFFVGALLWLSLRPSQVGMSRPVGWLRSFVEAFAVVTSIKYGVWAAAIIAFATLQGSPPVWEDFMLTGSHLGMAVEAILYVRLFRIRLTPLLAVAVWTFWNDHMDYSQGIFPWLPRELYDELDTIRTFTIILSAISLLLAAVLSLKPVKPRV